MLLQVNKNEISKYRGQAVSMARKNGKIGKKITPEIDKGFNRDLQGETIEKVPYTRNGGGGWVRTNDQAVMSRLL